MSDYKINLLFLPHGLIFTISPSPMCNLLPTTENLNFNALLTTKSENAINTVNHPTHTFFLRFD